MKKTDVRGIVDAKTDGMVVGRSIIATKPLKAAPDIVPTNKRLKIYIMRN